jgi:hypothetical protein
MNIILDMDGTLINERMEARPHLDEFFRYIFQHFNHVSIWTMADVSWFNRVNARVFQPIMPLGKSFHFVWCRVNCKLMQNLGDGSISVIKPLTEVYRRFPIIYSPFNTLIVDDTPSTYQENIGNAIKIGCYVDDKNDTELMAIVQEFHHRIFIQK